MSALEIDIDIAAGDWPTDGPADLITQAARAAYAAVPTHAPRVAVSVHLTDNGEMQSLNATFRGQDKPTNVLSFPGMDPNLVPPGMVPQLGDLSLAYETVRDEAVAQGKSFEDHLTHLIVHGMLHLLGHDHEDDDDAAVMEKLETEILQGMGIADPYGTDG